MANNKLTVYVSESGGPGALCAIKSFRLLEAIYPKLTVEIISSDCDNFAVGKSLSDKFYTCPMASKDKNEYVKFLYETFKKEKVDLIIPTGEYDVKLFSINKDVWPETKIFVSPTKSIDICQDKFLFYETLYKKFNMPLTVRGDLFQKPNRSAGSRNTKKIENNDDYIIQENLPGTEYTVDVFCDQFSQSMGTVVRERVVVKSGISTQSKVCNDSKENLVNISEKLCEHLKLVGPVCIQFKQDKYGEDKLVEVNPRLGGGSIVSTLSGVNFADLYYQLYKGLTPKYKEPDNIFVSRYLEEVVF